MRTIYKSKEFKKFYTSQNKRTINKIDYVIRIVESEKIINPDFVKKIVNSEFYELRIHTDNAYRVIIFAIDNDNINNSTEILLLNGFMKKSDNYTKYINQARTIKENFIEYGNEENERKA